MLVEMNMLYETCKNKVWKQVLKEKPSVNTVCSSMEIDVFPLSFTWDTKQHFEVNLSAS